MVDRRSVLQGIAASGIGLIGSSVVARTTRAVSKEEYASLVQANQTKKMTTSREGYQGNYRDTAASVEYNGSKYWSYGGYWDHKFRLSGQGVASEDGNGNRTPEIYDHGFEWERGDSNSELSIFGSPNNDENAMYPEASGKGDGDIMGVVTSSLSLTATALEATTASYVLGATALSEALLNLLPFNESNSVIDATEFYNSPKEEVCHHSNVSFRHYVEDKDDASKWANVHARSKINNIVNNFLITVYAGQAGIYPDSTTTSKFSTQKIEMPTFGNPEQMSKEEREFYNIKKIESSEISTQESDRKGPVYVTDRAPIQIQTV